MPQYTRNPPLDIGALDPDPMRQLEKWLADAVTAGQPDPTAMTLATCGADGAPTARIVLFKGLYEGGVTFYTNYRSPKGEALAADPRVALVFWWDRLERQLRIEGEATPLPRAVNVAYFSSRPRESQISAHASRQSRPVASRVALDARLEAVRQRFADAAEVPCPPFWGGFRVEPHRVEVWQGRGARAHDRFRYQRVADRWHIDRLEP